MGFIREELIIYVRREMDRRGWNQSDLARAARISPAALGAILNRLRPAGVDVCNGIANAFNIHPSELFVLAGLMPPEKGRTPLLDEIHHKAAQLSPENQQLMIALIDGLLAREKKDGIPGP